MDLIEIEKTAEKGREGMTPYQFENLTKEWNKQKIQKNMSVEFIQMIQDRIDEIKIK